MENNGVFGNNQAESQPFNLEQEPPFDPSLIAAPYQEPEAPDDEGGEAPVDPAEEARRWRERAEALEAEAKSEAERREALEAEQVRREAAEAEQRARAWQKAEQDAINHAKTLPHAEAIEYLDRFRREREGYLYQWGQELFTRQQQAQMREQAKKVAKDEGLGEEEVDFLVRAAAAAGDPRAMKDEAKRLKARSEASMSEIRELRAKLERMEAEQNRARLASSPATRVGQGVTRAATKSNVEPGSTDHFRELLGL